MKKSFRITNDNRNELKAIRDLEMCISEVKVWMDHDRLRLNGEKTEFIIYSSRQLKKCSKQNRLH